jgi:plasmid maintenance system antidote protein VapI
MNYEELIRNIGKAGLDIKEFAELIKANPNSITNLKSKKKIPKNIGIIAVLLGEMKEAKLPFKDFLNSLDLEEQKARRKSNDETLFKKKEK